MINSKLNKVLTTMLAMLVAVSLTACSSTSNHSDNPKTAKSLYEHGLEIISEMDEKAESKEFIDLYSIKGEDTDMIMSAGKANYATPTEVYKITVSDELIFKFGGKSDNADSLSDTMKKFLKAKANVSLISQINTMEKTTAFAAAAICATEKIFVSDELKENAIYLYTYENATPVAISFTKWDDNAVQAIGYFIFNEKFPTDTEQSIENFFTEIYPNNYITVDVLERSK